MTAAATRSLLYPDLGPVTRSWLYHDARGRTVGAVLRWDREEGKDIRPARRNPDGWTPGAMPAPRPLYRLPAILTAPDLPLLIVEGEKAADAAQDAVGDLAIVTTWAGGSSAGAHTDWSPLKGRTVRVWPDADTPGVRAGRKVVAHAFVAGARRIERLEVPIDWPKSCDAADLAPEQVVSIWLDRSRWLVVDVGAAVALHPSSGTPPVVSPARVLRVRQRLRRDLFRAVVNRARSVDVVEVARRLGCGDPVRRGKEVYVRCPLHEDRSPSLRLDVPRGLWFCDPCGEGGDAIRLWMRARRVGFRQAVEELVGSVGAPGQKRAVLPQLFGEPCPASE